MKNSLKSQLKSAQGNFQDFKWGGREEKHFRRRADRGFTLVEMIVTVAVLVILAAVLVPSMVGWIDRAQGKSYAVEARAVYLAAQTIESEHYDGNGKIYLEEDQILHVENDFRCEEIRKLSGVNLLAINIEKYSMGANPSEEYDILEMRVQFIPKGKDDAIIMRLKDGVWTEADELKEEFDNGGGDEPPYDGDGEWPIGG